MKPLKSRVIVYPISNLQELPTGAKMKLEYDRGEVAGYGEDVFTLEIGNVVCYITSNPISIIHNKKSALIIEYDTIIGIDDEYGQTN